MEFGKGDIRKTKDEPLAPAPMERPAQNNKDYNAKELEKNTVRTLLNGRDLVTLPTHNWKSLWASLKRMSQQLEEFGIDDEDEEVGNV